LTIMCLNYALLFMLLLTSIFTPELVSFWSCLFVPFLDMVVEKNLRGVLRSEVDRSVSRDSIIIVDSLNNIKVGQYQILHPIFANLLWEISSQLII
jgi:hypothetical protein